MEVLKEVTVTLNSKELKEIIKQYLSTEKNIDVKDVEFKIESGYEDNDVNREYKSYCLTKVICSGIIDNHTSEIVKK